MSFWNTVSSVVGSWFSSDSSSSSASDTISTIYEPDKLKIAELEKEKSEIMVNGHKELLEMNARFQVAIIQAQSKNLEHSAEVLKVMMADMNIMAQQRLELLENGHLDIVERIETLYSKLEKEIQTDNDAFNMDTLPKLLEVLCKFEEDSASHKLYTKSIDKQIDLNCDFFRQKINSLKNRQEALIHSSIKSKEHILEHSSKIVEDRMKSIEENLKNKENTLLQNNTKLLEK